MSHEKDIVILEEKILKNDTQLQLIIKEKSLLSTNTTLKDKEINELNQREAKLRLTVIIQLFLISII